MKTGRWTVVVVAMGLFGYGCGGMDCVELCEAANDCEGAEQSDCASHCAELDEFNDKADCGTKYDAIMSCVSDNEDQICSEEFTACESEAGAYVGCVFGYCLGHEDDPLCAE